MNRFYKIVSKLKYLIVFIILVYVFSDKTLESIISTAIKLGLTALTVLIPIQITKKMSIKDKQELSHNQSNEIKNDPWEYLTKQKKQLAHSHVVHGHELYGGLNLKK